MNRWAVVNADQTVDFVSADFETAKALKVDGQFIRLAMPNNEWATLHDDFKSTKYHSAVCLDPETGATVLYPVAIVDPRLDVISIESNGSKWAGESPDTIEQLLDVLQRYPLDPRFEAYGNFINPYIPQRWSDSIRHLRGCIRFHGNFYTLSHVFSITTNVPSVIESLTKAIRRNQERREYWQARRDLREAVKQ